MNAFLDILYKLSHETGLKLYPDHHGVCKLLIGNRTTIQLEMDPNGEKLLIGSVIIEIPLGKFREEVLKHALVANSTEYPYYGYLCYIQRINSLALYDTLSLRDLSGEALLNYIEQFAEKSEKWKSAIESGRPGPHLLNTQNTTKPPQFGMKP
jgi:hypothetical protein